MIETAIENNLAIAKQCNFLEIFPNNVHISFSEFSQYNQCPHLNLIYKFLKLKTQPPSIHLFFGSALHEAIEMSIRQGLTNYQRADYFTNKFRKDMFDNMQADPLFKKLDEFTKQGQEICIKLDLNVIMPGCQILEVEEDLYEKVYKKFFFKGFIDLNVMKTDSGRYTIYDWKTSTAPWDLEKKLRDYIFLCQMRFYKFFWAKKHNIDLDLIDCKYVVLNRLKDRKKPNGGIGEIQLVEVPSTTEEVIKAVELLALTIKKINILNEFPKVKFFGDEKEGCKFCEFKGGLHPLCNSKYNQYVELIKEHKK